MQQRSWHISGATLDHVVEETLYVLDVDTAFTAAGMVRKEAYAAA